MNTDRAKGTLLRTAAFRAAGFRIVLMACLASVAVIAPVQAQGRSGQSNGAAGQGNQGNQGSQGSPGNSGNAPGRSDSGSPGNSANAPGRSASGSSPGQPANQDTPATTSNDPPGLDQSDALQAVRDEEIHALKELLPRVANRYGGKVISVTLGQDGERLVYTFKIRSRDGRVQAVHMDARTGQFLVFPGIWVR